MADLSNKAKNRFIKAMAREEEAQEFISAIEDGGGVPDGGTTGQVLAKLSNADGDADWQDLSGVSVSSVNGQTGVVTITASSVGLGNVNNTSDINKPISSATQSALDGKQDEITGSNNKLVWKDNAGDVQSLASHTILIETGGLNQTIVNNPDGEAGSVSIHSTNTNINPIDNSPDRTINVISHQVSFDTDNDGFSMGTNGQSARMFAINFSHAGSSDLGSFEFFNQNFNIGNGTDPIDVKGFSYMMGFGTFNSNVNISGPIQGYGFQPALNAAATIGATYTQAFYDATNVNCESPNYTSFNSTPNIDSLRNNNNFTSFNSSPNIGDFLGNSGFIGLNVSPTTGTFGVNGYFKGVSVNPTISSARYAAGIDVSMDNVVAYAGVKAAVTIQDLTFEFIQPGSFNNSYTIEFIDDATAGSESVIITGQAIEVHIEAGVSTATQVKTACDANISFVGAVTTTISGTASDAQVAQGPTNFANGIDAGRVLAALLDGDVEITGSLTFGGALSIGKLNAFATQPMVNGSGNPASVHGLISAPTVGDNITLTSADTIAVNTAALISIGTNSSVSTSFIGVAALGLPAVLTMGAGSTLDRVYGALFALSLDAGAAGGTVDEVGLCRAVSIPNGTTTVNNLYGYLFDLPFGDPGTKTFGFYDRPGKNNYFAGQLLIGGTPGSDDTVTNSSVAFEIKSTTKAIVNARMSSAERDALTAINGMQLYNTTTNKLQIYAGGSWVDLH